MADEAILDPAMQPSSDEVAIDYIKSPDFRTVWADGVVGSITPQGLVHFAIYAERFAIPRRQVFAISGGDGESGTLGPEVLEKQVSRRAIVREMPCDIFLTAQTAENLASWLLAHVKELKKIRGEPGS